MTPRRVLDVSNLSITFSRGRGRGREARTVVDSLDLTVNRGEIVALVGESGSGKSVTARALLGLAGSDARVTADRFRVDDSDRLRADERTWRRIRGAEVGLILQDALSSLDPLRPIGREIADALRIHQRFSRREAREQTLGLLARVGMPSPELMIDRRSGELSGGMRQRALIAAAIALDPPVLIADEPTTALDVGVQRRILGLLTAARNRGTGILLISHDLAVVSSIADRIIVLDAGRVVEAGHTRSVLSAPAHSVTRALIAAVPTDIPRGQPLMTSTRPPTESSTAQEADAAPNVALGALGLSRTFGTGRTATHAVDNVSFDLPKGRTLGLVGESGSGKSTVARLVLGLIAPDSGRVELDGEPWSELAERDRRPQRRHIGSVYQDALGSFDPRWNVERLLRDALGARSSAAAIAELLEQVRLPRDITSRHPHTLSGGQRQRIAIARALATRPGVIVCDEPVSALDATVQGRVLDLFDELQREHGLSLLFVSHDLGVVRHMSDTLAVMHHGRIVEAGETEQVFNDPQHEVTRALLDDAPRVHRA